MPVALPEELSLPVKVQNPFITKRGEFTLDLELSLKEINNARVYNNLDRLHCSRDLKNRSAVVVSDHRVILNGTEVILKNTDTSVTTQIVSGNSELNYLMGSDVYISELNMGSEPTFTSQQFLSLGNVKYPESFYCPADVKIDTIRFNVVEYNLETNQSNMLNLCMQPFILSFVEKILTALGYTISYNQLIEDEFLCRLYVLNGIKSGEYNKLLPGWKAKDFLSECETFMNVVFDVNNTDKTVRLLKRDSFYSDKSAVYTVSNVIDNYERSTADDVVEVSYKNVAYDFPSSKYYKYCDIDPDVMKKANVVSFNTYGELLQFVKVDKDFPVIQEDNAKKYYKTLTVFYVKESDTYYLIDFFIYKKGIPGGEQTNGEWYYLRAINRFQKQQSLDTTKDDDILNLKFVPAQFVVIPKGGPFLLWYDTIPYQTEKDEKIEDENNIMQYIENGVKDYNSRKKECCIVIYGSGAFESTNPLIMGSKTDYVMETVMCNETISTDMFSLRLQGEHGLIKRLYEANDKYDFSKEYAISFISNDMPDVRSLFLINNKLFVCKELEYTVKKKGIHPVVNGIFFAVK